MRLGAQGTSSKNLLALEDAVIARGPRRATPLLRDAESMAEYVSQAVYEPGPDAAHVTLVNSLFVRWQP